eukprot:4404882-Amphidinium_carterae.1
MVDEETQLTRKSLADMQARLHVYSNNKQKGARYISLNTPFDKPCTIPTYCIAIFNVSEAKF